MNPAKKIRKQLFPEDFHHFTLHIILTVLKIDS